jgi:molybdopterin-containing oxidoreductase family iron-sulfur binding subunit
MSDLSAHSAIAPARSSAPRYWRSLEELAGDEDFFRKIGDEFMPDAAVWLDPTSRRNFLRIMGASLALAGLVGCNDFPDEKIIPYVNPPESVLPGKPTFYATAIPFCGYAMGALVESHEGRPTKIEGNPDHPASLGASNVFMQAAVLDLYDPDRSRLVTKAGMSTSWGTFYDTLRKRLDAQRGKGDGIRLLTRTITSPTFAAQLAEFRQAFPEARWHVHDPTSDAGCSARTGGAPGQAVYDFSQAGVILSLDGDFLYSDVGSLAYARQFSDGRRREPGEHPDMQTMNRLYVVDSTFSLTGAMADHRRAVKPSQVIDVARAVAARLGVELAQGATPPAGMEQFIDALAEDLRHPQQAGKPAAKLGVVVAGDHQPPALQALAHAMNEAIGSVGKAVRYIEPAAIQGAESLQALVADMSAGKVDTLLIFGGNPAYDAPADVAFKAELQRLTTAVDAGGQPLHFTARLGAHDDETSFLCQWHLPESHYLEAWGDARAFDGTASIVQPLIVPFSQASKSIWEMMEALLGRPDRSGYETVRAFWQGKWKPASGGPAPATQPARRAVPAKNQHDAGTFEEWWQLVLRKGLIEDSAFSARPPTGPAAAGSIGSHQATGAGTWQLVFRPDPTIWDGTPANNPWLQELPKPFTKLVWDNAALISHRSAEKLGVKDNDVVRITFDGRTLDGPIVVVPGHPDETLTLTLGYGRTRGGHVATEEGRVVRGCNAYALRTIAAGGFAVGAQVEPISGQRRQLIMTRSHHAMSGFAGSSDHSPDSTLSPEAIEHPGMSEDEIELRSRRLVRSGTLDEFRKDENWATRLGGEVEMRAKGISTEFPGRRIQLSIYPTGAAEGGWDYSKGYQWGMSIDQTACIGCNACVIACQAENNIPVVGKDECGRQREMHWIRVDDWFGTQPGETKSAALDDPQVIHMPVPCQQCENAPCELVCPVGATTHSVEGLNEMTYNRCIGTRYCSNNCPYKVRRFNFLLFADYTATRALQYNPEVSVRSRGVMEKCTYCVQRLNRTRMDIEKLTLRLEERAKIVEQESPEKAKALRDTLPKRQEELMLQLQTACQQACPTEAIVFGNKNDPASRVAKLKEDKLDYTLLAELTTQPRTSYLARLRNPNVKLE